METVLGLFGIIVWIAVVIGIAAAVTYVVVKIFPDKPEEAAPQSSDA